VPTPGKAGTLLTWQGKRASETPDWLAVDGPLEGHLGGEPFTFTMGTPGDDFPLVTRVAVFRKRDPAGGRIRRALHPVMQASG
jgi:hypothetical protein